MAGELRIYPETCSVGENERESAFWQGVPKEGVLKYAVQGDVAKRFRSRLLPG